MSAVLDEQLPAIVRHADTAHDAIWAVGNDAVSPDAGVPAPVVYQALGTLKYAGGYALAQALQQLARGLGRSLAHYDVYEDDDTDPVQNVAAAVDALLSAAASAEKIGITLDQAQGIIAGQGYRGRKPAGA